MAGNKGGRISTRSKNPLKSGGPCQKIGLLVHALVTRFLDQIAAEHHRAVRIGDDRDEIVVGVSATWMADRHLDVTKPEHRHGR